MSESVQSAEPQSFGSLSAVLSSPLLQMRPSSTPATAPASAGDARYDPSVAAVSSTSDATVLGYDICKAGL